MTTRVVSRGVTNPFPGLRPFREDEQHLFFGREAQVDRLIDKLAAKRFVAVVGVSGSGKSSLVNCGFRPALYRGLMPDAGTSWRMIQFRPGGNPINALACALSAERALFTRRPTGVALEEMVEATLRMSSRGLIDIYKQARLDSTVNLLIVVDQFEELFRYHKLRSDAADSYGPGNDATGFVRLLMEAYAQSDYPIYVVLTMRSDFLGDCSQFDGLPEAINEGQYLVPRMTRDERRSAIAGPVEVAGGAISNALLTRLVNDVGDNPDQLSILQHALNRTWARWENEGRSEGPLSLDHYERIGTMEHALDFHAEKAYGELRSERQRAICEKIFKSLTDQGTDPRGIRRPTKLATLCSITGATAGEVVEVIDVFRKPSRSFLMPPLPEVPGPETIIDISHETLMRVWVRLKKWAVAEAESAREYRRLVDRAAEYPHRAGLLQDPDLQVMLDWEARQQPTGTWAEFYGGGLDTAVAYLRKSAESRDHVLAQAVIDGLWRSRYQPLIAAVVAIAFLLVLIAYRDDIFSRGLDNLSLSNLDTSETRILGTTIVGDMLKVFLLGSPFAAAYWLLSWRCRKILQRFGFPRALKFVQSTAKGIPISDQKTAHGFEAAAEWKTSYASWWRRWIATVIDAVVVLILAGASLWATSVVADVFDDETELLLVFLPAFLLTHWLYQVLMIRSPWHGTLGMRATGIFVTDLSGRQLSIAAGTVRHTVKLLNLLLFGYISIDWPVFLFGLVMCLGPVQFLLRRFPRQWAFVIRRQGIHDILSRSVVLARQSKRKSNVSVPAGIASTSPDLANQ